MKTRDDEGNVHYLSMPNKNTVLKEHLQNLEFAPVEGEALEFKVMLLHTSACERLDKKLKLSRPFLALNASTVK